MTKFSQIMLRFFPLLFLSAIFACNSPQKAATHTPPPAPRAEPRSFFTVPAAESASIVWLNSERLMPVLEQAQRESKPVFVDFYASWCAPCKVMEEEIFTQPETARYLNTNFLNFHTDFDSPAGSTIASIYDVKTLPTVLFLDPQGVVLERHTGMANPSVLLELGNSAIAKMKR